MAKKRKGKGGPSRPRTTGQRPAATRQGPATRRGATTTPTARPSAAGDGAGASTRETTEAPAESGTQAQNRIARKEEARRQREALRRKIARRRKLKRAATIGGGLLALGAIVWVLSRPTEALSDVEQRFLSQAASSQRAAGCGDVERIPAYSPSNQDQLHIGQGQVQSMPPLSSYPSQPPASGPHASSTLPAGVYDTPPPLEPLIHSLEHGGAVIWFSPDAPEEQVTQLKEQFREEDFEEHVIVAPYNYPAHGEQGQLPEGKQMVLVAWHRMQSCDRVNVPAAYSFAHRYATTPDSDYEWEAPEAGAPI